VSEEPRALIDRLTRLEKQVRYARVAAAAVLVAGASFFLLGQAAPATGVIEAKDFVLRDSEGRLRARLFMDESFGGPALTLYDEHVSPRWQAIRPLGGAKPERDQFAVPRLTLRLMGNNPYLGLSGPEKQNASLTVQDTGPLLTLSDGNEKAGLELLFIKGRGPTITLTDADQNIRARLEVDRTEPYLKVLGTRGAVIYADREPEAKVKQ
jgi:hypothetical protein